MGYRLGVDLGTTYTAAAVNVDGRVEMLGLGIRAMQVPSVVFVRPDGEIVVGEAAEQQGAADPSRVVREFKRRIGDSVPLVVGGSPFSAQALTARLLAWVVGVATRAPGRPAGARLRDLPGELGAVQARPAGPGDRDGRPARNGDEHLHRAGGGGDRVRVAGPGGRGRPGRGVRPGRGHVRRGGARARGCRASGWWGRRRGSSTWAGSTSTRRCSGTSCRRWADDVAALDDTDPATATALARLRRDCVEAKEVLSFSVDTVVPVALPGITRSVRLTRGEFDDMLRPAIAETVSAMRRVLEASGVGAADVVGDGAGRRLVADPAGERDALGGVRAAAGAGQPPEARRRAGRGDPRHPRRAARGGCGGCRRSGRPGGGRGSRHGCGGGTGAERAAAGCPGRRAGRAAASARLGRRSRPVRPTSRVPGRPAPADPFAPVVAAPTAPRPSSAGPPPPSGPGNGGPPPPPPGPSPDWRPPAAVGPAPDPPRGAPAARQGAVDRRLRPPPRTGHRQRGGGRAGRHRRHRAVPEPLRAHPGADPRPDDRERAVAVARRPRPHATLPQSAQPLANDVIVWPRNVGDNWDITTITAAGAIGQNLTDSPDEDNFPVISADRRTIVYLHRTSPTTRELHVMGADGTGDRPLLATVPPGCADLTRPAFGDQPVPQLVLPCLDPATGETTLNLVGLDGTVYKVVDHGALSDPAMTPDGRFVVYWRADGAGQEGGALYRAPLNGRTCPCRSRAAARCVTTTPPCPRRATLLRSPVPARESGPSGSAATTRRSS